MKTTMLTLQAKNETRILRLQMKSRSLKEEYLEEPCDEREAVEESAPLFTEYVGLRQLLSCRLSKYVEEMPRNSSCKRNS